MTDVYNQEVRGMPRDRQLGLGGARDRQMSKGEGSTSASGGFSFSISGKNFAGVVTALTVATPFVVLFSPVLLSVFVVVFLLATGYFTAREVGGAAKAGLSRMYEYVTSSSKNRTREDSYEGMTNKLGLKGREMKDRDEPSFEGGRFEGGFETGLGGFDNTTEGEGEGEESSHNLMKAATAATTGTSLVAFSGLTFIGTVIALILATPPLVLFSPVLVPALITVFLLVSGFVASGGFGVAAASVLAWTYKLYSSEGRQTDTSRMFGSKPQESRNEEIYQFGSKPRESRSEETRMFGSKPQESRSEETRMAGSKQQDQGEKVDKDESRKPDSKLWETRDRDEREFRERQYPTRGVHETAQNQGGNYQVVAKAATATTAGGSLIVLSGLTFVGTVIGLTVATPLMVLFSPVLVPAVITIFLLGSGLLASGGFTVAGVTSLGWLYKYVTKEQQTGTNLFDQESRMQGSRIGERRDFTRNIDVGEERTQGVKIRDRSDRMRDIDTFEEGTLGAKNRDRRDFTRDIDMGEEGRRDVRYTNESGKGYNQMVKAATATTAGGSFIVFSGLTFVGTVLALIMATPLLVLFSPVLAPAFITLSLLATGFVASGGFGISGMTVLAWLYRYATSGQQGGEGESYDNTMNTMDLRGQRTPMTDQAIRTSHQATGDVKSSSGAEKGDNQAMVKAATAATTGGSMLVFSGLTFAASVIALSVATPLFVIFSPVLVPALITMFLLPTGFVTSGGFGVAGTTILSRLYKSMTSGNRTREDSSEQGTRKMGSKDWEMRDIGDYGIGEGRNVAYRGRVAPASHHQA